MAQSSTSIVQKPPGLTPGTCFFSDRDDDLPRRRGGDVARSERERRVHDHDRGAGLGEAHGDALALPLGQDVVVRDVEEVEAGGLVSEAAPGTAVSLPSTRPTAAIELV